MRVFVRDNFTCRYCGYVWPEYARADLQRRRYPGTLKLRRITVDHVIPRSRGGSTSFKNLVTACSPCNSERGHQGPQLDQLKAKVKELDNDRQVLLRAAHANVVMRSALEDIVKATSLEQCQEKARTALLNAMKQDGVPPAEVA